MYCPIYFKWKLLRCSKIILRIVVFGFYWLTITILKRDAARDELNLTRIYEWDWSVWKAQVLANLGNNTINFDSLGYLWSNFWQKRFRISEYRISKEKRKNLKYESAFRCSKYERRNEINLLWSIHWWSWKIWIRVDKRLI